MGLLCSEFEILWELLSDGSGGVCRYGQLTGSNHDCVLHYLFYVFFSRGFLQHFQYLPIHADIIYRYNLKTMNPPYQQDNPSRLLINSNIQNDRQSFINNSQVGTPQQSRISTIEINNTEYVPKIIQTGYIVGPPVAYTQQPNLPPNYTPFSPSNRGSQITVTRSNNFQHDFSPNRSRSITPNKSSSSVIVNPGAQHIQFKQAESRVGPHINVNPPPSYIRQDTVSKSQYDHVVNECKNWETKYNELYLKYMNQSSQAFGQQVDNLKDENFRLRQRVRDLEGRSRNDQHTIVNVKDLMERYKESTLKQMYLLVDRYRLECKQNGR